MAAPTKKPQHRLTRLTPRLLNSTPEARSVTNARKTWSGDGNSTLGQMSREERACQIRTPTANGMISLISQASHHVLNRSRDAGADAVRTTPPEARWPQKAGGSIARDSRKSAVRPPAHPIGA